MVGKVRVGRRKYNRDGTYTDPKYEGYKSIICMTKCSEYGSLSPYELKNENNQILENIWQFSKVYKKVPKTTQKYSRYSNKVIWKYDDETHIDDNNTLLLSSYWNWRTRGKNSLDAIRYPVGFSNMSKCLFAIKESDIENLNKENSINLNSIRKLNYIQARKEIYLQEYKNMVRTQKQFKELKKMLDDNINLLIIEVDGPHQETMNYYKQKYNVKNDFIVNDTIEVNQTNMSILLNDEKHPFGHGYCLGIELLDLNII